MTKSEWKKKIKAATKAVGTYRKDFDGAIDTLADIMSKRDMAQEQFEAEGNLFVVAHVNKNGDSNIAKNPLVMLINDLNRDSLMYWRDLGLTPAGLKKINDKLMRETKEASSGLVAALESLGG